MSTLRSYRSPPWEVSFYKNLPIEKYSKDTMKLLRLVVGRPLRVKFRGPRPWSPNRPPITRQSTCLKQDAVTFTVYAR